MLTMPTISINRASFRYRGQEGRALSEVSFDVQRGEFLALLGGDGAGKSTLCKALNGLIPHHIKGEFSGDVLLEGRNTRDLPVMEIVAKVGLALQDPETQLFTDSVEEEVAFAPENLGLPWAEIDYRVKRALESTGMSALAEKSPSALSGGQKQRLAIASAISMMPSILVLDEPLSMLDPRGRAGLLSLLDSLRKERGITVILTSNTAEEIAAHCDRIALLSQGKLISIGRPEEMLTSSKRLTDLSIEPPQLLELSHMLVDEKIIRSEQIFFDEKTGANRILSAIGGRSAQP